jgi:hypothetical protein
VVYLGFDFVDKSFLVGEYYAERTLHALVAAHAAAGARVSELVAMHYTVQMLTIVEALVRPPRLAVCHPRPTRAIIQTLIFCRLFGCIHCNYLDNPPILQETVPPLPPAAVPTRAARSTRRGWCTGT